MRMKSRWARWSAAALVLGALLVGPSTASAMTTLNTLTATTNYGRTCTITIQGDSPHRTGTLNLFSYIEYGGSVQCGSASTGSMFTITAGSTIYPTNGIVGQELYALANGVTSSPGNSASCGSWRDGINSCAYAGNVNGYPGQVYSDQTSAQLYPPTTPPNTPGEEYWTSYPAQCHAVWVYVNGVPSGPVSDELDCSDQESITAS